MILDTYPRMQVKENEWTNVDQDVSKNNKYH